MIIGPWKFHLLLAVLVVPLFSGCGGCRDSTPLPAAGDRQGRATESRYREELLTYAVDNLDRLDEFSSAGMLPQIIQRLDALSRAEQGESDKEFDPLLTPWPASEMLRQIVDRLNQWIRPMEPSGGWRPDPMLANLPEPLADLPQLKELGQMEFTRFDGFALREAAWMRDVALWARGDRLDDLQRAIRLFDWTVRNIQIEADRPDRIPLFPWETLLFGRGTADERAWVFILLLRQLGIEAATLAVDQGRGTGDEGRKMENAPRVHSGEKNVAEKSSPWCVGVLVEGRVYLFDPLLGLTIPAPDGIKRDDAEGLKIHPATLDQVRADGQLLERLDVEAAGAKRPYRVRAGQLDRVTALLEASPPYLSRSMKMLESRLAGRRKMVLSTSPSELAERWGSAEGISAARLWRRPFHTLLVRSSLDRRQTATRLAAMLPFYVIPAAPLYRGRLLYLKGEFVGDDGAMQYYQRARPSNAKLRASSADALRKLMLIRGKQDASFWCGLIAFQRGDYSTAADYFMKRSLEAYPDGPWTRAAKYNLARTYEVSGQTERAILMYGSDASSPGYHGDLLRARWLREGGQRPNESRLGR